MFGNCIGLKAGSSVGPVEAMAALAGKLYERLNAEGMAYSVVSNPKGQEVGTIVITGNQDVGAAPVVRLALDVAGGRFFVQPYTGMLGKPDGLQVAVLGTPFFEEKVGQGAKAARRIASIQDCVIEGVLGHLKMPQEQRRFHTGPNNFPTSVCMLM